LVSHDIGNIQKLCSRALLLQKGRMVCIGSAEEVCNVYQQEGTQDGHE